MKKGITPVISIIILLLITVALAGMAWTYLQSVLMGQVEKSIQIPRGGAFCESGKITAYVMNTGTGTLTCGIPGTGDFVLISVNEQDVPASNISCSTIPRQESAKLIDAFDCDDVVNGCGTGYKTVRIGTGSVVITEQVYC